MNTVAEKHYNLKIEKSVQAVGSTSIIKNSIGHKGNLKLTK